MRPAFSLVGYPDEVVEANAFVFSDTIIRTERDDVRRGCAARSRILVRAQKLRGAEERVAAAQRTLAELEREEASRRAARDKWRERMHELEIKEHELRLLDEQVGSSNAARVRSVSLALFISRAEAFPCHRALDRCAS